jgi:hypothetical protein
MSATRRFWSAAELAVPAKRRLVWPAFSIAFLCLFTLFAPPGFITGMNLYLLLLVAIGWLATRQPLDTALLWAVLPFGLVIVVGLLAGVGSDRYLYLKDAWYVSNPAVVIAVGFVLGRLLDDPARGLRAFVIGGALVALLHLSIFVRHPELLLAAATQIRSLAGTGYYVTTLAMIVLLGWIGRWRSGLGLHPVLGGACLLFCTTSFVFSFSRTLSLVVLLGLLGVAGFFARREWLRVGLLLLAMVAALAALEASVDTSSLKAKNSFLGKLARSAQEIRVEDYTTVQDINLNWRGYETSRALDTWQAGNPVQWVFGQGFGKQVDLGLFQNLSGDPRAAVRFIPIFHNGYVFLLVKTGVAGVALYLAAMLYLYRVGRRAARGDPADPATRLGRALQSSVVVLAVSTWVVAGAFNKYDMFAFLMLIGFLLAALVPPPKR